MFISNTHNAKLFITIEHFIIRETKAYDVIESRRGKKSSRRVRYFHSRTARTFSM